MINKYIEDLRLSVSRFEKGQFGKTKVILTPNYKHGNLYVFSHAWLQTGLLLSKKFYETKISASLLITYNPSYI